MPNDLTDELVQLALVVNQAKVEEAEALEQLERRRQHRQKLEAEFMAKVRATAMASSPVLSLGAAAGAAASILGGSSFKITRNHFLEAASGGFAVTGSPSMLYQNAPTGPTGPNGSSVISPSIFSWQTTIPLTTRIRLLVEENPDVSFSAKDIVEILALSADQTGTVRQVLSRLFEDEFVFREGRGRYRFRPPNLTPPPISPDDLDDEGL